MSLWTPKLLHCALWQEVLPAGCPDRDVRPAEQPQDPPAHHRCKPHPWQLPPGPQAVTGGQVSSILTFYKQITWVSAARASVCRTWTPPGWASARGDSPGWRTGRGGATPSWTPSRRGTVNSRTVTSRPVSDVWQSYNSSYLHTKKSLGLKRSIRQIKSGSFLCLVVGSSKCESWTLIKHDLQVWWQ